MYDGETRRCVSVCDELPETASGSILCEVAALEGATPLMVYDEDYFKGAPAVAVHEAGEGRAYYLATRFEPEFYKAFYARVCEDLLTPAWPKPLPDGVLAVRRGRFTFLQNASDAPARGNDIALAPYETAVFESGERIL